MTACIWIVGRGGMLGSRLARELAERKREVWQPPVAHFSWNDTAMIAEQLRLSVAAFAATVPPTGRWTVIWAAGTGTVGSSPAALQQETTVITLLLAALDAAASLWSGGREGALLFASSAGTIYGNADDALTEESALAPVSPYGREKQVQEEHLRTWAANHADVRVLLARITNLYGEEQNLRKPQGIVSHVAQSILRRLLVRIYVPFDTARDYLYVGDCAAHLAACLDRLWASPSGVTVKLSASECVTTLADIIGMFGRIAKRLPPVLYAPVDVPAHHVRSIRFRSVIWPDLRPPQTPMCVGIHRVLLHQRRLLGAGRLG